MRSVASDDRALLYGDGLFETIRFHRGRAALWAWHMERLIAGCARLALPAPDLPDLQRKAEAAAARFVDAIVKILWSAGRGPRGYARPQPPAPHALIAAAPLVPASARIAAGWCRVRLAIQPALAGIKHLNRLEQVLAAQECQASGWDEGLMQDMEGGVVAASAGNVCARIGGRWLTPPVERCGIAGVGRRWWLTRGDLSIAPLSRADIEGAEAVAVINAVRGPRQVIALGDRRWPVDPELLEVMRAWQCLHQT
jgi:4-amino-4-deoxychorismate lyase